TTFRPPPKSGPGWPPVDGRELSHATGRRPATASDGGHAVSRDDHQLDAPPVAGDSRTSRKKDMTRRPAIEGTCDARFARVRDAFAENFATHDELGAAVAVMLDGQMVVDLWGGHADVARTRPWRHDTLVHVYSTTKGIVALAAHVLADRGQLDLDAPVARYWPEFAAAGKDTIPVHQLLSHRAGLPAVRAPPPPTAPLDRSTMTAAPAP